MPPNRITAILKDERGITGDTAIRLGTFFKTSAEFWMNLQMTYDLRNAEKALPARVRKSIEDNRMKEASRRHGDPAGNIFQNVGGILDEPANDLRPA